MPIQGDLFRQAGSSVADTSGILQRQFDSIGSSFAQGIRQHGINKEKEEQDAKQEREALLATEDKLRDQYEVDPIQVGEDATASERSFVENLNEQRFNAANDLVGESAQLNRDYANGKITREDYNKQNQALQRNLSDVKNYEEFMNARNGTFKSFQDDPESVSAATSNQSLAISKAMDSGDIQLQYNADTNKMEFKGTYNDPKTGEPVEFNASDPSGFPGVVTKTEDPSKTLLTTNQEINQILKDASTQSGDGTIASTGTTWEDPAVQAAYDAKITELVDDDATLQSLAADFYGIDPAMATSQDPEIKQQVKDQVKTKLLEQAQGQFFGNEQQRVAAAYTVKRQQNQDRRAEETHALNQERSTSGGAGLTGNKAFDVQAKHEQQVQDYQIVKTALTPNEAGEIDATGLIGKGNIIGVETGTGFFSGKTNEIEIQVKGVDEPLRFELNENGQLPPAAKQFIYNQAGINIYVDKDGKEHTGGSDPLGLN